MSGPEWISWDKTDDARFFGYKEIAKSGMEIVLCDEDADGRPIPGTERTMIVGDVNEGGGMCDCCQVDGVVVRYRQLVPRPEA